MSYQPNPFRPDPKPEPKPKKAAAPLKRTKLKPKHKATGEAEVFRKIWAERPHICTNCRDTLGHEARAWFFAHIIPKSRAPALRLVPENIRLLCRECHFLLDQGTKEQFKARTKL